MDSASQLIFITDVTVQMATLRRIAQRLDDRVTGLTADDIVRMESAFYKLHNFYNAVEDLLKLVAAILKIILPSQVNGTLLLCVE